MDNNQEDQAFVDSLNADLAETRQKLSELQDAQHPFWHYKEIRDLQAKAERLLKLTTLGKNEGIKPAQVQPDSYRTRIAKRIFKDAKHG